MAWEGDKDYCRHEKILQESRILCEKALTAARKGSLDVAIRECLRERWRFLDELMGSRIPKRSEEARNQMLQYSWSVMIS